MPPTGSMHTTGLMPPTGLMIAAPRSGSGKTTVTLGLVAALHRRGIAVRAAKSGPDYIDPAFLSAASGTPCFNLDSWAMPPRAIRHLLRLGAAGGDVMIVEGSMGLFDGIDGTDGRSGASADIARLCDLPVILVLDVSGQAQTAACTARGFIGYSPGVRIGGVILNRVGSDRHRATVSRAMDAIGLPVLGSIPRQATLVLPERHLGLVQAEEHPDLLDYLNRLTELAERHLDIDRLLDIACPLAATGAGAPVFRPPGQRIALARDAAFSFVYPHLLLAWRAAGAEIRLFSPLANEPPPADCDICWLPGGYPELHAGKLATASRFHNGLRHFAQTRPVHGECGGYMVLGESIEDAHNVRHPMTGLLGHSTSFAHRRLSLGYRRATLLVDCPLGPAGATLLGHEFHYATIHQPGADLRLARIADGRGADLGDAGGMRGRTSGSFFHMIAEKEATA